MCLRGVDGDGCGSGVAVAVAAAAVIEDINISVVMKTVVRVGPMGPPRCLLGNVRVVDLERSRTKIQGLFRGGTHSFAEFQKFVVVLLRIENNRWHWLVVVAAVAAAVASTTTSTTCRRRQLVQSDPGISDPRRGVFLGGAFVSARIRIHKNAWWQGIHQESAFLFGENVFQRGSKRTALFGQRYSILLANGARDSLLQIQGIRTRRRRRTSSCSCRVRICCRIAGLGR
mmetsp:Transcript_20803/g.45275  ORF Transcript_20803/g.45275 Transcript_20803/m.45275 type:complete len:229 (+) Transcript_20803:842-1528(+)